MTKNLSLYNIFTPNLFSVAVIKKYRKGDIFTLSGHSGLVMEGVVAVDGFHPIRNEPITLRLAGEGELINLQEVFSPVEDRQYICETEIAVIAIVSVPYFKGVLSSATLDMQAAVYQEVAVKLNTYYLDVVDSLLNNVLGSASSRLLWAIRRYHSVSKSTDKVVIGRERLSFHAGIRFETVSRTLTKLQETGGIAGSTRTIIYI